MLPPELMPPIRKQPARTFVKRGFYLVCTACGLAIEFCACPAIAIADRVPEDGPAAADLNKRIEACKGK